MSPKTERTSIEWPKVGEKLEELKEETYKILREKVNPAAEIMFSEECITINMPTAETLKKLRNLDIRDILKIQEYVLIALYYLNPPRRSMDFTEAKFRNYSPKEDNYIENTIKGANCTYNKYKTKWKWGTQKIENNKRLKNILTMWVKIIETRVEHDYMLINRNYKKLDETQLTKRLNKILGEGTAVIRLRQSCASYFRKDEMESKEEGDLAYKMGHSVGMNRDYRRVAPHK